MFTGIIQHMGQVISIQPCASGAELRIDPRGWSHSPAPGESIAVNGCCLTLAPDASSVKSRPAILRFDVVPQTLRMTTLGDMRPGDGVNLEHAATPATLMGGHIVQGHVDGVGVVTAAEQSGQEWSVRIEPPEPLLDVLVDKGSITVDGVSLTIAGLGPDWFEVALIPTTLKLTNLSRRHAGSRVNLEADCIAKTVVSWLKRQRPA